jgi:hypothetical protein
MAVIGTPVAGCDGDLDRMSIVQLRQQVRLMRPMIRILHEHLWRRLYPEYPDSQDAADVILDLYDDPEMTALLRSLLARPQPDLGAGRQT